MPFAHAAEPPGSGDPPIEAPATPEPGDVTSAETGGPTDAISEAPPLLTEPVVYDVPAGYDNGGVADDRGAANGAARADTIGAESVETMEANAAEDLAGVDVSAAAACTLYVSPSGRSSNSGRSSGSPLPLRTAVGRTQAGDTVCLLAGTYYLSSTVYINRSGTSGSYITYRSEGGTADLRWTGGVEPEILQISSGTRYIEVRGLRLYGANRAGNAIKCNSGGHHVRAMYNTISSFGSGGVTTKYCDYATVHGNTIHHVGYSQGWGSAISINSSRWLDRYAGFHTFVTNNVISGTYDNDSRHTDGNGIIIDRSYSGTSTPPALIANNVVFGNYGRCIHAYLASNAWIVNNTCYRNGLKYRSGDGFAEISIHDVSGARVINNVAYAGTPATYPFKDKYYEANYQRNVAYSGRTSQVPSYVARDTNRLRVANPLFESAFSISGWSSAPTPGSIGTRLAPTTSSPLRSRGIDPRYAEGMTSSLRTGMSTYLRVDVQGRSRPQGGGWDIGAYER